MVNGILSGGKDITQFVNGLIDVYRDLLIVKLVNENYHLLINASQDYIDLLVELCKQFTEPQIARGLNAFIELSKSIKYAQNQRIVFEATLVKVLHPEADVSNEALMERVAKLEKLVLQGIPAVKAGKSVMAAENAAAANTMPTGFMASAEKTPAAEMATEAIEPLVIDTPVSKAEPRTETKDTTETKETTDAEETAESKEKAVVEELAEFTDSPLTFEMVQEVWHTFMEAVQREKKGIYPALDGAGVLDVSGSRITIGLKAENKLFVGVLESKQNYDYLNQLMRTLVKHVSQLAFTTIENEALVGESKEKKNEQEIMAFFNDYKDVLEIK
jgi:DNA polymerase-3 subunit gamma/tau